MIATSVQLSTLQDTIRRAVERFPRERARIERAALLIALGHVAQAGASRFAVRSQTNPNVIYGVTAGTFMDRSRGCTCQDAQRHPGQSCKHQWAVDLVQVAEERQRRLDAAERFSPLSAQEIARLTELKRRHQAVA